MHRPRPAYRHTVENSVYVADGQAGRGVGRALLAELIASCAAAGARQMIAVIGDNGHVGPFALHDRRGYAYSGPRRSQRVQPVCVAAGTATARGRVGA